MTTGRGDGGEGADAGAGSRRNSPMVLIAVLSVAVTLTLLAGCGSGSADKFAGTWVDPKNPSSQVRIVKNEDGSYTVMNPDASGAWSARPEGNVLKGTVAIVPEGASAPVDIAATLMISGDAGTYALSYLDTTHTYDIQRK